MFTQVEPFQQSTEYNCSAAVLHAVAKRWGFDFGEWPLAALLEVDPINGASTKRVVKIARQLGFQARSQAFKSLNQMKRLTDDGVPVIARILSFKRPDQYHFVVVTNIDDFDVSMMDPNVEGNRRRLTYEEMWAQWGPERIGVIIAPELLQLGEAQARPRWFWVSVVAVVGVTLSVAWRATRSRI